MFLDRWMCYLLFGFVAAVFACQHANIKNPRQIFALIGSVCCAYFTSRCWREMVALARGPREDDEATHVRTEDLQGEVGRFVAFVGYLRANRMDRTALFRVREQEERLKCYVRSFPEGNGHLVGILLRHSYVVSAVAILQRVRSAWVEFAPPFGSAEFLFRFFLDQNNCSALVGDLEERYRNKVAKSGSFLAGTWFWSEVVTSLWALVPGIELGQLKFSSRRERELRLVTFDSWEADPAIRRKAKRYRVKGLPFAHHAWIMNFGSPTEDNWRVLHERYFLQGAWTGNYSSSGEALAALAGSYEER